MRVRQSNWLGGLVAGAAVSMAALVLGAGPLRLAAAPPAPAAVSLSAEKGLLFSAILFDDTELVRLAASAAPGSPSNDKTVIFSSGPIHLPPAYCRRWAAMAAHLVTNK